MLDGFPNQLTESVNHLCLLDTAFFVNSSYPPLLRPERKVDLIIHLNYCAGSQTKASVTKKGSCPLAGHSVVGSPRTEPPQNWEMGEQTFPHGPQDLASERLKLFYLA